MNKLFCLILFNSAFVLMDSVSFSQSKEEVIYNHNRAIGLAEIRNINTVCILNNRTKEIAIRKVFGAGYSRLLWLVYKEFILMSVATILISAPIAWYFSSRWLESFHRQISVGPGIFIFSFATLLLFTVICISYKGIQVINSRISDTIKNE
jgi:hypothetical protein